MILLHNQHMYQRKMDTKLVSDVPAELIIRNWLKVHIENPYPTDEDLSNLALDISEVNQSFGILDIMPHQVKLIISKMLPEVAKEEKHEVTKGGWIKTASREININCTTTSFNSVLDGFHLNPIDAPKKKFEAKEEVKKSEIKVKYSKKGDLIEFL